MVPLDNSFADMYRAPPRPLPYDADPRFFRLQQPHRLLSTREKGSENSHGEGETLRTSVGNESEISSNKNKWSEFGCVEGCKDYNSRLSSNLQNSNVATGFSISYDSSEEEDVCPTCLEGA